MPLRPLNPNPQALLALVCHKPGVTIPRVRDAFDWHQGQTEGYITTLQGHDLITRESRRPLDRLWPTEKGRELAQK